MLGFKVGGTVVGLKMQQIRVTLHFKGFGKRTMSTNTMVPSLTANGTQDGGQHMPKSMNATSLSGTGWV